jgi:hypothetical protein
MIADVVVIVVRLTYIILAVFSMLAIPCFKRISALYCVTLAGQAYRSCNVSKRGLAAKFKVMIIFVFWV